MFRQVAHPRAAQRDNAATTIQRAYRSHVAFDKLRRTSSRVSEILARTPNGSTFECIKQLHALIAELGAVSAVLDHNPYTANDTRVFQTAHRAAISVRRALEDVEDSSISSGSNSGRDKSSETPVSTETKDDSVWVYSPRFAHVQSCLDLSASDALFEKDASSIDSGISPVMVPTDISDSDSEFEQLAHARARYENNSVKEETLPVTEEDYNSDGTIEDFHEDSLQTVTPTPLPSPISSTLPRLRRASLRSRKTPSTAKPSPARLLAEARCKEHLAILAAHFSGNDRRWAGQLEEPFPPPKRTRRRSYCALPPPPDLFVIEECAEE